MRAFLTGFAGFIGSHLVDRLLASNWSVVGQDDFSADTQNNIKHFNNKIDYTTDNITKRVNIYPKPDVIFHLAAKNSVPRSLDSPLDTFQDNILGTVNVLEAARKIGCEKVILASSSSVYGTSDKPIKHEDEIGYPLSPYAASKRSAEIVSEAYGRCYGMGIINLRFFNVFGPRQKKSGPYAPVIAKWWDQDDLTIYGDGEQMRDFTYVENVIDALMLAAEDRSSSGTYNIGCGKGTRLTQLALMLNKRSITYKPARKGDVKYSIAHIHKAGTLLGYEPRVSLEEAIHKMKVMEEKNGSPFR